MDRWLIDIHVHALESMPACVSARATHSMPGAQRGARGSQFSSTVQVPGSELRCQFWQSVPLPSQPSNRPQFLGFLALVNGHQMMFKAGGWGFSVFLAATLGGHSLLWCHRVFTGGGEGPHPGILGARKTPSADNHKCP